MQKTNQPLFSLCRTQNSNFFQKYTKRMFRGYKSFFLVTVLCFGLTAAQAQRISVMLPGASTPEYTSTIPANLPDCDGDWIIEGDSFDGLTYCGTDPSIVISVNPFRCTEYSREATVVGNQLIHDCETCAWGFGSNGREIDVYPVPLKPIPQGLEAFFVPQRLTNYDMLRSCVYVLDPNLASICSEIQRSSTRTGRNRCMTRRGSSLMLPREFKDSDPCRSYLRSGNQVVCTPSQRR